jgi:hypothetical protein
VLAQSQDPLSPIVVTAQNLPSDPCPECESVTVTAQSLAGVGSAASGWLGLGLSGIETFGGTSALSLRYGFYGSPRRNQYGIARKLSGLAHAGGYVTLGAATLFDLLDYSDGGPDAPSMTEVGTNFGMGAAGLATPLLLLPASQYFLFKQLYDYSYPGGSNQAFMDLGGYLDSASRSGVGP